MKTRTDAIRETTDYPTRPNRYLTFGWNRNYQDCYTPEEVTIAKRIQTEYEKLGATQETSAKFYFSTHEENHWYGWWQCIRPAYDGMLRKYAGQPFTLPSRESKDSKAYPLWDYSDKMARQIANWQAERADKQPLELTNDPIMFVFEELRDWFFNILAIKECKKEDLEYLTRRQSYIKNLIHLIPDFGKDRLRLQEMQQSLEGAYKVVLANIANRELPQLLSGMIIDAKSLENTLGTYLHFLLANERVDDNYSTACLERHADICQASPVSKVYQSAEGSQLTEQSNDLLAPFQSLNSLYQLSTLSNTNGVLQITPTLRVQAANAVHFATFANDNDKKNYIEALAVLEALINVRRTLENFRNVQSNIGTYFFAYNYLDKTSMLTQNYISLVMKANGLLSNLIQAADRGMHNILAYPDKYKLSNQHFEKNLRTLETSVVRGTTLKDQLEDYCKKAISSMKEYNNKMEMLVSDIQSGKASKEVERAMRELFQQVNDLNLMLTAVLNNKELLIDTHKEKNCLDAPFAQTCQAEPKLLADGLAETPSAQQTFTPNIQTAWDQTPKPHFVTGVPVYTYRLFHDGVQVGTADYYGQPSLCISTDGKQHNMIQRTGFLRELPEPTLASINEVCKAPFPTLSDKALHAASHSVGYGILRGTSNTLDHVLQSLGYRKKYAYCAAELTYYVSYFATRYFAYSQQSDGLDAHATNLNSMYNAAVDTGQAWLISRVLNWAGNIFDATGKQLEKKKWHQTGKGLRNVGKLTHYGLFAVTTVQHGVVESTSALVAGSVAENITERTGHYLTSIFLK